MRYVYLIRSFFHPEQGFLGDSGDTNHNSSALGGACGGRPPAQDTRSTPSRPVA